MIILLVSYILYGRKSDNRSWDSEVQCSEVWKLQKMQKRIRFNSLPSCSFVFNPLTVNLNSYKHFIDRIGNKYNVKMERRMTQ